MKSFWDLRFSSLIPPSSDPSTKLQPAPLILFISTFKSYFSARVKLFNHRLQIPLKILNWVQNWELLVGRSFTHNEVIDGQKVGGIYSGIQHLFKSKTENYQWPIMTAHHTSRASGCNNQSEDKAVSDEKPISTFLRRKQIFFFQSRTLWREGELRLRQISQEFLRMKLFARP